MRGREKRCKQRRIEFWRWVSNWKWVTGEGEKSPADDTEPQKGQCFLLVFKADGVVDDHGIDNANDDEKEFGEELEMEMDGEIEKAKMKKPDDF
ncbi:hypothetical protein L6452_44222 [Arctium lappa]|uniref:Uncharacterized protein n=1 Tax=Arctium lappa TaxID=4217 RepID=A0ACB8XGA6_ARCLA|nr:hypothetical protein L6452_44222 [Arctium lappa]